MKVSIFTGKNILLVSYFSYKYTIYNLFFLHSVLVPSSDPYSDPCFEKQSVSEIFPNRRFQKNSVIVPYPYFVFSNTSELVPYSVTSFEFSPVPVIFPYPYPWVRIWKKYGSDPVVRGMTGYGYRYG